MPNEPMRAETDVLVIGSGAAGMYAAFEAATAGCRVLLADRSLIGRGGATVMAQMTVAVALGSETPDHWTDHYQDTLKAGRGLCNEPLARLLCEEGPACICAMDEWGASAGRGKMGASRKSWPPVMRPSALCVCGFSQDRPRGIEDAADGGEQNRRRPQGGRPLRDRFTSS